MPAIIANAISSKFANVDATATTASLGHKRIGVNERMSDFEYAQCLRCGDKARVFASGLVVCKGCGATNAAETPNCVVIVPEMTATEVNKQYCQLFKSGNRLSTDQGFK